MTDEMAFEPGQVWLDTDGEPIQAHGGGVLYNSGTYYWFGENKKGATSVDVRGDMRVDVVGVSCYSSTDLYRWKNEGVALPSVPDDPSHDLHPSKVVERPKVIYNDRTRQFVMWMHIDRPDYQYARTGVAVSDRPAGPYHYVESFRPGGSDSRDMTIFQDGDGQAYVLFSSDSNSTLKIARLTDDYLRTTDTMTENFVDQFREAPAIFADGGNYFLLSSGCTGWFPNEAQYAVASSPLGPWEVRGNPCTGPGADVTFQAQSTFVLPVAGQPGAYIFLADRWNRDNLSDSRYVWLPIAVQGERIGIRWRDRWDLSIFDQPLSL